MNRVVEHFQRKWEKNGKALLWFWTFLFWSVMGVMVWNEFYSHFVRWP